MTQHVALYCRLSPRPDGSYEGVDSQEGWGREYATKTWPGVPVEVFADRGVSAANGDHRPDFERLRKWLADGKIAHVWTVEQARLTRGEIEWFQLAADFDAAGITELHTNRDGIVRVRDEVSSIKAVLAAAEVRRLRKRVNDRLDAIAKTGAPSGADVFGYRHGKNDDGIKTLVIEPAEAEAIQWAANAVVSGWSLTGIANELTSRGHTGVFGGTIGASQVRNMLTRPTVAGHRVHRGEIVGPGNWEPILDEATWEACRAKLSQPRTVKRADGLDYSVSAQPRITGRRYLLTGDLARCHVCKAYLIGSRKQFRRKSGIKVEPWLLCHVNKGGRGCVGIQLEPTDKYVLDELWAELDKPEFLAALAADDHADQRDKITNKLEAIATRRKKNARRAGLGEIDDDEWDAMREGMAEQERSLRSELAELPPPAIDVDIAAARAAWPAMTLGEQREFIRLFIKALWIRPAKLGLRRFDTDRLEIDWRAKPI